MEFLELMLGTVIYRPYVYAFFACFLTFSVYQMGWIRTWMYTVMAWALAFTAEFSSTRIGIPFGYYYYLDATRDRELWISNVPFWDSLSFVFLSYFSFILAAALLSPGWNFRFSMWPGFKKPFTPVLGGFLMMLLDVVIDPVALQGSKWFLGQVYGYPEGGIYFGVTLANFAGWWLVGAVLQYVLQKFIFFPVRLKITPYFLLGIFAVYTGVFGFNLFMTFLIKDYVLAAVSSVVAGTTSVLILYRLYKVGYGLDLETLSEEEERQEHSEMSRELGMSL